MKNNMKHYLWFEEMTRKRKRRFAKISRMIVILKLKKHDVK